MDSVFGLANLIVYYFISKALGAVTPSNLSGAPTYFDFAAVGASMALVIQVGASGLARRVREEQLTGTLEALIGQPVTTTEIALGVAGFPFMFAIFRAGMYIVLAAAFLGLSVASADWLGFAIILLISGVALGAIGMLLGGVIIVMKRGETLILVTTLALGFLGGSVFPRSVLPDWIEFMTTWIPTRFAFDGLRNALFLGTGWTNDAIALSITAVILFPIAAVTFGWAINFTRSRGMLGEY